MVQFYRIRDWQNLYENNRTRELRSMLWIPIPTNLSGDGYTTIMMQDDGEKLRKEGPAIFGTFIAILELSSKCNPRGDLLKSSNEPHTFQSIGKICRISCSLVETTILFCITPLKWIQIIDLDTNCEISADRCGEGAASPPLLCNVLPSSSLNSSDARVHIIGEFEKQKFAKRSIIFVPPTIEEFTAYCKDNGFESIATKAFKYYSDAIPPWTDKDGKPVRSWKQKLQGVWFKNENNKPRSAPRFGRQEVDNEALKEQARWFMEKHAHE